MRIAITGGTGFVGGHLARELVKRGHEVVLISRGKDPRNHDLSQQTLMTLSSVGVDSVEELTKIFSGCDAIAHFAGINRQIGSQTYSNVHVKGTMNVITAAKDAEVNKIIFLSFLRARPQCGSKYHESKWEAEELIRSSGIDYTILKAGVIYGKGDHMLDRLSHALHTFPMFGFVGLKDQPVSPLAIKDFIRISLSIIEEGRLQNQTVAVIGPEQITLVDVVHRVGKVIGKKPIYIRLPVWVHYLLAAFFESVTKTPLVSEAQVRILSEDLTKPLPFADSLPPDLQPRLSFSEEQIQDGLPDPKLFSKQKLWWFRR